MIAILSSESSRIPGPGFIHPHMYLDSLIKSRVHRGKSRAIIHKGKPSGIAMSQDIDWFVILRATGDLPKYI